MEDLVTFEIAKKLKEKGFRDKCLAYYDVEDNVGLLYNTQYTDEVLPCQYTDLLQCHNTGEAETQSDDSGNCVDAPTISQALKWLREKGVDIYCTPNWRNKTDKYYVVCIVKDRLYNYGGYIDDNDFNTYEDAALAGIEYSLNNLI